MTALVVRIGSSLRQKPGAMILLSLVWLAMLGVAAKIVWADYVTSVGGYGDLVSYITVSDPSLIWFVGALPQLIKFGFGFVALEKGTESYMKTRRVTIPPLVALMTILGITLDAGTAIWYSVHLDPLNVWVYPIAIIQMIILLGADVLLIAAVENLIEYAPAAFAHIGDGLTWATGIFAKGPSDVGPVSPDPREDEDSPLFRYQNPTARR